MGDEEEDGVEVDTKEQQGSQELKVEHVENHTEEEKQDCKQHDASVEPGASLRHSGPLRQLNLPVVSGELLSVQRESFLSDDDLTDLLGKVKHAGGFRWFAGRSILDFKVN